MCVVSAVVRMVWQNEVADLISGSAFANPLAEPKMQRYGKEIERAAHEML